MRVVNCAFLALILLYAVSFYGAFAQPDAVPGTIPGTTAPSIDCSAENATINFPTECPASPEAPSAPSPSPAFNAAFSPVKNVTSIIYGFGYAILNILLIVGLIVLIKCFKRKAAKPRSKANPGS